MQEYADYIIHYCPTGKGSIHRDISSLRKVAQVKVEGAITKVA